MKARFSIVKRGKLWVGLAILLFIGSRLLFLFNARYSEEFTGWINLWINSVLDIDKEKVNLEQYLIDQWHQDVQTLLEIEWETTVIKIYTKVDTDEKVAELSTEIKQYFLDNQIISSTDDILQQTITWPSVGSYMQKSALRALVVWIIFIVIYMLFSFWGIRNYLSASTLWLVTVLTMIFDVSIPIGAYGLWMSINSTIQIDTIFFIALLTTLWYSINDTIIVFDRIRENIKNKWISKESDYEDIFENSIWQTMKRSIGTSFSTLLVVISMFIFGTGIIKKFSLVIWVGIIAWTLSSIFIAAPLTYMLISKSKKKK